MEDQFQSLLAHFYKFAKSYLNIDRDASINFISDPVNSVDVLGKTAHYDPDAMTVTVYVDGRHPKDILRSVAHELVHHRQNCQGKMDQPSSTEPGYAQNDPHLRGLEEEAYLKGNMCFRDWEDKYKANREIKTIYESTIRNFIKERINMKSNDELRNTVKEAVTKVLNKRTLKEFDRYGDEFASDEDDAYFADLEKEFPDMGLGDTPASAEPDAPSDVKADMEDEFGSNEPEEEMDESMFTSQEDFFNNLQRYQDGEQDSVLPSAKDKDDDDEEEETVAEAADPVGPVEAQKCAELLKNLGFTLTRGGMNSLVDFLGSLEQSGDLSATPDSRRGAMAEKSTEKHNDDPALTGDQKDELPDHLQKAIIDKEDDEEESTNEAEDFYTQLRKDARTISEDWNKDIRNKRSSLLNERLMKAWKFTK